MTEETFHAFPKMGRLYRDITITEKIDGSNGQILIEDDGSITAGSRQRWITPGKSTDNFGFARWVEENHDDLLKLGPGRHFGEWWGVGIQRSYDLHERRFSLFNPRWATEPRPDCCHVVPVIYRGPYSDRAIETAAQHLRDNGSMAAPGFSNPEGIIIFHEGGHVGFKHTFDGDGHKGNVS